MKEDNKIEVLTRELIKKELKAIYSYNLLILIANIVPYCAVIGLLLFAVLKGYVFDISNFADIGKKFVLVACAVIGILCVVFVFYFLYSVCKFASNLVAIRKNKFEITTDRLVDKKENRREGEYSLDELELPEYRIPLILSDCNFAIHFEKRYVVNNLCFSKYKWFEIPEGKLYRWSEKYKMEHWAVYRWAEIGDEFYVVTIKNKPVYVYNTKYFELKE